MRDSKGEFIVHGARLLSLVLEAGRQLQGRVCALNLHVTIEEDFVVIENKFITDDEVLKRRCDHRKACDRFGD